MTADPGPTGPRRLKDDPDFRWETGCDLADEASVVGGYDLAAARETLMARLAAGAVPSAASAAAPATAAGALMALLKPGVGILALLGAVGGAYLAGLHAGSAPIDGPAGSAPVVAPAVEDLAPAPGARELPRVATSEPAVAPAPETRTEPVLAPAAPAGEPPRRARAEPQTRDPRPTPVAPTEIGVAPRSIGVAPPATGGAPPVDAPIAAPIEPAPPASSPAEAPPVVARPAPSGLEQELRMYDRAGEALANGDAPGARDGYRAYLATFPSGSFRPEAQLGLLQALYASGDPAGVERLASEIQDQPEFSSRRSEILRLRAESLVLLERCDEAVAMVDALPSRDGAEIRRACRSMRRE